MENILLICKKLRSSINDYSFSATSVKFMCIIENLSRRCKSLQKTLLVLDFNNKKLLN